MKKIKKQFLVLLLISCLPGYISAQPNYLTVFGCQAGGPSCTSTYSLKGTTVPSAADCAKRTSTSYCKHTYYIPDFSPIALILSVINTHNGYIKIPTLGICHDFSGR